MTKNVLLIGVGPHSKRVYIPWLLSEARKIKLIAAVELIDAKEDVKSYFKTQGITPEIILTKTFKSDTLPVTLEKKLTNLVKEKRVDAVIIASEPTAHIQYALWALQNNLHILMDKPITTRANASTNHSAAKKILKDFVLLEKTYKKALQRKSDLLFSINVQRRFDPKFDKIRMLIQDVAKKTNCPITSIQSSTADGQWRLPNEILDINYHGFNEGYGKGSHSGYHTFDVLWQFITSSADDNKRPDNVEIMASVTRPTDYFAQLTPADYSRFFSQDKLPTFASKDRLAKITKDYGEIDLFTQLVFKRGKDVICTTQSSLLHNSYSRRSWPKPRKDLYKGNGRVKQEHYFIEQGPFQALHIHSYQSFTKSAGLLPYDRNGKEHFEIHIFRNSKLLGGKSYERISAKDFIKTAPDTTRLKIELEGKALVMEEFFDFISKKTNRNLLRSDFFEHVNTVRLMSGVYTAQIRKRPYKTALR